MSEVHETFDALAADSLGTVYHDSTEAGLRFLVCRGFASLCAYVGVPVGHLLAGKDYDDSCFADLPCHGGLTFSAAGGRRCWPAGWWWYGWDYMHLGDRGFPIGDRGESIGFPEGQAWTAAEVIADSQETLAAFQALLHAAEVTQCDC